MSAQNVTVVGMQWGDEGKGKVVDALAASSAYVVRYCGGANAGHTVVANGQKFAFHLIPCGILHPGTCNVIGNGVAFDPEVFLQELDGLTERHVAWGPDNIRVSHAANVVMSYHKLEDKLGEAALGDAKIGTTARGIGPCYADKARRSTAIRAADLICPDVLADKIRRIVEGKNKTFAALYGAPPIDAEAVIEQYVAYGRRLAPLIGNTGHMLRKALDEGQRILFEGGQGSMLDIDHGTYPFVTSSSVSACGVSAGAGVPPSAVGQVVGLTKAYTSRVGSGPFPTEQNNEIGNRLRERGREYGTTTGRPRRCGWFDAFAVRYAADLSGVHELTLSLLDVLSGFEQVKICTGYRRGGKLLEAFDASDMGGVECVYETMPGWTEDITSCKTFNELPRAARDYVSRLETLLGRPVGFISVGPGREQTISHRTKVEGLSR
ncbi:MAG: adenylosuccinate synthase [Planctomycetota bacterium]|nr:adenylosuccinate synthase [Planctomycetota bacterium]